jgi:serine/threonine protein kinase
MASQEPASSNVGFAQREHDILSLLSIFVYTHQRVSAGLSLLGTILDDHSFYMPTPVNQGGYFEVYIITSKKLLEASFLHGTDNPPGLPLPKVVAVKGPKVRGKLNDRRNQKLWTSMAMELQILKHELVKDHENVVKLLGLCWRSIRGTFMPAFVLEAARSDLYSMIQSFEFTLDKMSTRKILGLAVDICSGLSVLHEVGIIHGDMKPQNVLIFEDPKLGFVAKITDFGSSLLKTDIKEPIVLPYNTDIWQAPECQRALDGAQLIQADTFSLGLVLCYMLSRGFMLELWKAGDTRQDLEGEDFDEYDRCARRAARVLQLTLAATLEAEEEKLYGPISSRKPEGAPKEDEDEEFDENETYMSIRNIQRGVLRTVIPSFFDPSLRPSAKSIHENIRICLSWLIRRDTFYPVLCLYDPFTPELMKASNFNDQERDVVQNPGTGLQLVRRNSTDQEHQMEIPRKRTRKGFGGMPQAWNGSRNLSRRWDKGAIFQVSTTFHNLKPRIILQIPSKLGLCKAI